MSESNIKVDLKSLESGLEGIIATANAIIKLTSSDNVGSYISSVGIILLIFSVWSAYKLIQTNVSDVSQWHKFITFSTLGCAILCIIAGPAASVFYFGANQQRIAQDRGRALETILNTNISQNVIAARAKNNDEVKYMVRLIPYDPDADKELSLARVSLASLGPPLQKYTFVADYDELKGYTVAEAVRRSGLPFKLGQHVTAVIFPLLSSRELIPANARGLLQVLEKTASDADSFRNTTLKNLSSAAKRNLAKTERLNSWAFGSYKEHYPEFCRASFEFVCNKEKYLVASLMGKVTHDWHPLGFARLISQVEDPCDREGSIQNYCSIRDWPDDNNAFVKEIGTRIFFTNNDLIADIKGRILFDFYDPNNQKIPIIFYE